MSNTLLMFLFITNLGIAISYFNDRNYGMALAFACYAFASVGFILTNLRIP